MKFKVYYTDGSTFAGDGEKDVINTPAMRVALILQEDKDHGRQIVSLGDYYVWRRGRWVATDREGKFQYDATVGIWKYSLLGEMMPVQDEWHALNKVANEDPDFQPRTGFHSWEKR